MNYPFPQAELKDTDYSIKRIMPSNRTQVQMNQDVIEQFVRILPCFIVDPFDNQNNKTKKENFLMALHHPSGTGAAPDGVTVSESMGFGFVILAYMAGCEEHVVNGKTVRHYLKMNLPEELRKQFSENEVTIKHYFDAMFRTLQKFPSTSMGNEHGTFLMSWQLEGRDGHWRAVAADSSATDGDMDMAYALVLAARQWKNTEYLDWAKGMMHQLYMTCTDRLHNNPNYHLTVGNWAQDKENCRITRPSDFMLQHLRTFKEIDNVNDWGCVLNAACEAVRQTLALPFNTTGMMPDFLYLKNRKPIEWIPSDGSYGGLCEFGEKDAWNYFNACRVPMRLGIDVLHGASSCEIYSAVSKMNKYQNEINTKGNFGKICGGSLDGSFKADQESDMEFISPYVVTAAACGSAEWMTSGWDYCRSRAGNDFNHYGDYINIISMIKASGNWWNPAGR